MFTGLDLVVVLIVFFAFFYATGSSGKGAEFKLEPLTLLIVAIVVGMVAFSLLRR